MFAAIRLSLEPRTRWSTSTPTRRSGPGRKSRRWSARSSTPPRYSTTTPSMRRSSPQTFSTSSASCRPSTKIRLARATRAFAPWTATDPDAVRVGLAGRGRPHRRGQDHRLALEQEAGAEREGAPLAAAVLQGDGVQVAVDRDDLAAPVGGDLLDDGTRARRAPRRRGRASGRASRWRGRRIRSGRGRSPDNARWAAPAGVGRRAGPPGGGSVLELLVVPLLGALATLHVEVAGVHLVVEGLARAGCPRSAGGPRGAGRR